MNKTSNTTSSQVMELHQLIAGPLMATIEADAMATQSYLDYLKSIAFESDEDGGSKLRYMVFKYQDQSEDGMHERQLRIPLVTMVPLPLLHVEEADFDFDIKILDALTRQAEERFDTENEQVEHADDKTSRRPRLRASLAPKMGLANGELQKSLAANMKIKVKMRQSDMPSGVSNLLHVATGSIYSDNIEPKPQENGNI